MNRPAINVGFYGKLPCRGDFLQRRAPQGFVDVWDAWLQEGLHESRQRLQDAWLDSYLTGPVWRFVLSAGVCGAGVYAGVLVPSVDRVGRYFPLTVIAQLTAEECPLGVACGMSSWFESAESLAIEAVSAEALDFDTFDEHVALLRERLDAEVAMESAQLTQLFRDERFPADGARWQVPLGAVDSLQSAVNVYAWREMNRTLQPLALWWTQGSGALTPSWLATRGLPDSRASVAMLTGEWTRAEWATMRAEEYG
ncbi:MAG: type VI secretion system-associated protein TagF [Gammaproteobacteria bacterium]